MSRIYEWLIGVIVLAVALLMLWSWGYRRGVAAEKVRNDAATAERIAAETRTLTADRDAALRLAKGYEADRNRARSALAARRPERVAALAAPASCPTSGVLGDVVVPAAVVRGVFVDDADAGSATRPAAGIAHGALLGRPAADR